LISVYTFTNLYLPLSALGTHPPDSLDADVLEKIDEMTKIDAQVFASALRLLLGRLRRVEEAAGVSLLKCIDWEKLHRDTGYISGLWEGPEGLLLTSK
jgi:hypothetical protein